MWQDIKNIYHLINALIANVIYGFPSRRPIVIGVTGTDGKTTTTSYIYQILKKAGVNVSMVSSVGAIINNKEYLLPFHVTTPSSFALQKFIKMAASNSKNGKKYLVLEVTSHSLHQFRVFGIKFDIGVITNVTHEHLDYHKTYRDYLNTKIRLLKMSKIAVINKDDASYKKILPVLKKSEGNLDRIVTYSLSSKAEADLDNFELDKNISEFNKYNMLSAITVVRLLGIKDDVIKKAVKELNNPIGRQDIVYNNGFKVMIDFAHTPHSFEKILSSLKPTVKGKIIHVFGSAGERDSSKRPIMGEISDRYSDILIITSEDPRAESIEGICDEILSQIKDLDKKKKNGKIFEIYDRQEAINRAIAMASKGDIVLITGKAHEKSMNYGKGEVSWDEYRAVKKALTLRKESHEEN